MCAFIPQFLKQDTIAAGSHLNSGETSFTLTSGNFGTPTGTQLYVVDYDVPAKAEIISATVAGTAVTSVTRGLTGGAAGTTDHAEGAKVGSIILPQHISQFAGEWTAHSAVIGGFAGGANPTFVCRYKQIDKTVFFHFYCSAAGTSNATNFTVSLPVASKNAQTYTGGSGGDNGAGLTTPVRVDLAADSATATVYKDAGATAWTNSGAKNANFFIVYESV